MGEQRVLHDVEGGVGAGEHGVDLQVLRLEPCDHEHQLGLTRSTISVTAECDAPMLATPARTSSPTTRT